MQTHPANAQRVYTYVHLYSHSYTRIYTYVHTCIHPSNARRHRRQLKLTSCWPTPRGAVCMSVCECVPLILLNTKYACISVFVCFYILPVVQLQCSFERLYKNFAISPNLLPVKRCSAVSTEACYFVSGTQMILLFNQLSNGECQSIVRCVL